MAWEQFDWDDTVLSEDSNTNEQMKICWDLQLCSFRLARKPRAAVPAGNGREGRGIRAGLHQWRE